MSAIKEGEGELVNHSGGNGRQVNAACYKVKTSHALQEALSLQKFTFTPARPVKDKVLSE